MEKSFEQFSKHYLELMDKGEEFAVVQIVEVRGSAPQDIGARAIIHRGQIYFGTIGGGKLEAFALKAVKEAHTSQDENSKLIKVNLQNDIGMTCGGEVSLFFEFIGPKHKLKINIFGAGHVSQELNWVLSRLDCEVVTIDHREEWLNKLKPLETKIIKVEQYEDYVPQCDPGSFVVVMTMGHSTDLPVLKCLLERKSSHPESFPYIGVIGSEIKAKGLKKTLLEEGLSPELVGNLKCPIGMKFGNNSPSEIAISIAAEILQERDLMEAPQGKNHE